METRFNQACDCVMQGLIFSHVFPAGELIRKVPESI